MTNKVKIEEKINSSEELSFELFLNSFEKYDPEKIGIAIFEKRIKNPLKKIFEDICTFSETYIDNSEYNSSGLYKIYYFNIFRKNSKQNESDIIATPYLYLNLETIKFELDGISIVDTDSVHLKQTTRCLKTEIGILVDSMFPINLNQGCLINEKEILEKYRIIYNDEFSDKSTDRFPYDLYLTYDEILSDYRYIEYGAKLSIENKIRVNERCICEQFYRIIINRVLRLKNTVQN